MASPCNPWMLQAAHRPNVRALHACAPFAPVLSPKDATPHPVTPKRKGMLQTLCVKPAKASNAGDPNEDSEVVESNTYADGYWVRPDQCDFQTSIKACWGVALHKATVKTTSHHDYHRKNCTVRAWFVILDFQCGQPKLTQVGHLAHRRRMSPIIFPRRGYKPLQNE